MSRPIIVPLTGPDLDPDGSSEQALPIARWLAKRTSAPVVLISTIEMFLELGFVPGSSLNDSEVLDKHITKRYEYLDNIARTFPTDQVQTVVRVGHPDDEILGEMKSHDDPVSIMASQGVGGLKRIVMGSIAFQCVQRATCPVIVVPVQPDDSDADMPSIERVLIPLDGSEVRERALEAMTETLEPSDMDIHLIQIDTAESEDMTESEYLEDVARRLEPHTKSVTWEISEGDPDEQIKKAALEHDIDLIAMATRGRIGFRRLVFGSLAESIARESKVPLLLVGPAHETADVPRAGESDVTRELYARDIMTSPAVTVQRDTTLEEVAQTMLEHGIGGVIVVDGDGDGDGKLQGIITESDFTGEEASVPFTAYSLPQLFGEWLTPDGVERIYAAGRELTAGEIMTTDVITVTEDEPVTRIVELLITHGVNRVPIIRDNVPVGMVARRDLLKMMLRDTENPDAANTPANES